MRRCSEWLFSDCSDLWPQFPPGLTVISGDRVPSQGVSCHRVSSRALSGDLDNPSGGSPHLPGVSNLTWGTPVWGSKGVHYLPG